MKPLSTPEETWDEQKKLIFVGEVPDDIESLVQKGFSECPSESYKWEFLGRFFLIIRENAFKKVV